MNFKSLEKIKGISLGIAIGFVLAGLLAGCGSTATTSTSTSTGSGSGTTSDATLVTQQVDAFKTALLAMKTTTLDSLISSAYSEAAPGGTSTIGKSAFLAWLHNGMPMTIMTVFSGMPAKMKIGSVTATLGTPAVSGSVATVEGSLVVGTGTAEVTLGGRALTDMYVTYHFPALSLRFVKESGTWLLAGFSAPVLGISGSQFGLNSNPPPGEQAKRDFEFQLLTYKADALVTDIASAAKPTVTSSNLAVSSDSLTFRGMSAPGLGNTWAMAIDATLVTADLDIAISGLKSTSAAGGTSFSFTHKVDVGQTK